MAEGNENFLKELEERFKLGLLDTLEDTHVAFRILLAITDVYGKDEIIICTSHLHGRFGIQILSTHRSLQCND